MAEGELGARRHTSYLVNCASSHVACCISSYVNCVLTADCAMQCRSPVSQLQLGGYGLAFVGVCWYNYQKLQGMKAAASVAPPKEQEPLMANIKGPGGVATHHHGRT